MNLTFGPMMKASHRFTDMYIDDIYEYNKGKVTIRQLVEKNY